MFSSIRKKSSTIRHWDQVYQTVEKYEPLYYGNQQLLDLIVRFLQNEVSGKKILEVGCGKAKESLRLADRGADVTGIDYSDKAIALLRTNIKRTSSSMKAIQGDARALPFDDGSFDLVYSQGVIEHFEDPLPLLKEQYRVLRDGGIIIVEVPNKYNIYTIYKRIMMILDKWPPGWETEFTPRELCQTVINSGFEIMEHVGWDTFVLRALRKIAKRVGIAEMPEKPWQVRFRRAIERTTLVTWFALSISAVGRKRSNLD